MLLRHPLSPLKLSATKLKLISLLLFFVCLCDSANPFSLTFLVIFVRTCLVFYDNGGTMLEIFEIAARDNVRKSILVTSVPLSSKSQLEWVGFNVMAGQSVCQWVCHLFSSLQPTIVIEVMIVIVGVILIIICTMISCHNNYCLFDFLSQGLWWP